MNAPITRTPVEDRATWKRHREIVGAVRKLGSYYFCAEAIGFLHDGSERRDDAGEPCAQCLKLWERVKGCSTP